MARTRAQPGFGKIVAVVLGAIVLSSAAWAQVALPALPAPPTSATPAPATPYASECRADGTEFVNALPLPNVARALQTRKKIRILAIGASSFGHRGRGAFTELIESMLEQALKGIDVVMINRGVSGELAADAAIRIKNEVAINEPDLVLWQVGTNDALAFVPLEDLRATITETVRWLRAHNVDVVLAGLQYVDRMAQDAHYNAVRELLRKTAVIENVIIVRRYEAMQMISQAALPSGAFAADEFERTERGYLCLAQYLARAITLGVFGKGLRPLPPRNGEPGPAR
jgi:lysophospholipase L1-like esterase